MTADRNSDAAVATLLKSVKTIALVGASDRPNRPSYGVMQALLAHGFTVYPVNPMLICAEVLGQKRYDRLDEVPAPVDMVDIFRNAKDALAVVREAIALKDKLAIKAVWLQLGIINPTAMDEAEAAGLTAVMDRCPKIEFARGALR